MSKPHTALEPESALSIVLQTVITLPAENVSLADAVGRVLAQSLPARIDQPRFDKAAVDGYGIRPDQGKRPFRVVGTIAAGDELVPGRPWGIERDEAIRIMTGAVVPTDVGRLIRFEYTKTGADKSVAITTEDAIDNIARAGENITAGAPLLECRRLTPIDIGILASQGYAEIPVFRRPSVAVLSTGTELRSLDQTEIPDWAIYDSNSYQLAALLKSAIADVSNYGILSDDQREITASIKRAVTTHDMVVVSGGVSMGDLDFVPAALTEIGATVHFHGLALKPGRPTLYATANGVPVFGLPGNPVSTLTQFELFIAPALAHMQGVEYRPREGFLPLATRFERSKADRHEYLPGYLRDGSVHQIGYMGSGHLSALATAELLFRVDRGVREVAAGEAVYARFIR